LPITSVSLEEVRIAALEEEEVLRLALEGSRPAALAYHERVVAKKERSSTHRERARVRESRRTQTATLVPHVAASLTPVAAAAAGMSNPLAVALVATIPALVALAATGYLGDAKGRLDRWMQKLCGEDASRTPDEIRALYEEKVQSSPSAREAVLRAVNKLLEADECSVDAIAAITHEYVSTDRKPDDVYRGVLALFAGLSSVEYETLRALLRDINDTCGGRGSHAHFWATLRHDDRIHVAAGPVDRARSDSNGEVDSHEFRGPTARRIVRLLRNSLLVQNSDGSLLSTRDIAGESLQWFSEGALDLEVAARLLSYVR
jgi:hypothetical protein